MDSNTVRNKIAALKNETQKDSISPERLGTILDNIVDCQEDNDNVINQKNTQQDSAIQELQTENAAQNQSLEGITANLQQNVESIAQKNHQQDQRLDAVEEDIADLQSENATQTTNIANNVVDSVSASSNGTAVTVSVKQHGMAAKSANLPVASNTKAGILKAADYKKFNDTANDHVSQNEFGSELENYKGRLREIKFYGDTAPDVEHMPYTVTDELWLKPDADVPDNRGNLYVVSTGEEPWEYDIESELDQDTEQSTIFICPTHCFSLWVHEVGEDIDSNRVRRIGNQTEYPNGQPAIRARKDGLVIWDEYGHQMMHFRGTDDVEGSTPRVSIYGGIIDPEESPTSDDAIMEYTNEEGQAHLKIANGKGDIILDSLQYVDAANGGYTKLKREGNEILVAKPDSVVLQHICTGTVHVKMNPSKTEIKHFVQVDILAASKARIVTPKLTVKQSTESGTVDTLTVSDKVKVKSALEITGPLRIYDSNDTQMTEIDQNGNVNIEGNAYVDDDLTVGGESQFNDKVTIDGDTYVNGDFYCQAGDVTFSGYLECQTGVGIGDGLTVGGDITMGNNSSISTKNLTASNQVNAETINASRSVNAREGNFGDQCATPEMQILNSNRNIVTYTIQFNHRINKPLIFFDDTEGTEIALLPFKNKGYAMLYLEDITSGLFPTIDYMLGQIGYSPSKYPNMKGTVLFTQSHICKVIPNVIISQNGTHVFHNLYTEAALIEQTIDAKWGDYYELDENFQNKILRADSYAGDWTEIQGGEIPYYTTDKDVDEKINENETDEANRQIIRKGVIDNSWIDETLYNSQNEHQAYDCDDHLSAKILLKKTLESMGDDYYRHGVQLKIGAYETSIHLDRVDTNLYAEIPVSVNASGPAMKAIIKMSSSWNYIRVFYYDLNPLTLAATMVTDPTRIEDITLTSVFGDLFVEIESQA